MSEMASCFLPTLRYRRGPPTRTKGDRRPRPARAAEVQAGDKERAGDKGYSTHGRVGHVLRIGRILGLMGVITQKGLVGMTNLHACEKKFDPRRFVDKFVWVADGVQQDVFDILV